MSNKINIDDLGSIIKNEFEKVNERFDKVDERFDKVDDDIKVLKQGQENLELRLSNVAYRFELKDLESRVKLLEDSAKKNN